MTGISRAQAIAAANAMPLEMALGLVLGANLGSGLLAVLTTLNANVETRQVPLGNLVFKIIGIAIAAFGGALGQGRAASSALDGIARNPNAADKMFTPMILGLALIESLVIYSFVISILITLWVTA